MAEPDLVISAGFSDAQMVKEANRIVALYAKKGQEAQKAFQDAQGKITNTQAVKAHLREMDKLAKTYDPAYRAAKQYEAEVLKLDRALDVGAIGQKQYAAEVERAARKMRDAGNATEEMVQKGRAGGTGLQNIGYQVGDFAVQVGAGTSAAQALGQQLPQLLGGLGTIGALMGAGAAIAIPLGAALLKVAMDTETLDEKLESLEKTTGAYLDAVDAQATPLEQLRVQYGDLADEIQRVNDVTASLTRVTSSRDLIGAAQKMGKSLVPKTSGDAAIAGFGAAAGVEVNPARSGYDRITDIMQAYKVTREQAELLLMAFNRLATSNSQDAVAKDAENLRNVLISLAGSMDAAAERFPDQMGKLNQLIQSAADQIAAADRAHRQAQQDLLDTYDANTQKLKKLANERTLAEESQTQAIKDGKTDQAEAYGRVIKAIDAEVQAVKKSISEMDGTFEASVKRMKELAGDVGGSINDAIKNWTGLNLSEWGSAGAASQKGILDLIASRESKGAGEYNAAYGGARFTGGNLSLVNMTLNEILAVQRQMLANPENTANSSALGRYQIVGTTLKGLMKELGLTGDELFDKDMQDRLATQLVRRRLPQGVDGLRNEWEGLRNVPAPIIEQALNQQSIPREDVEIAAERKKTLQEEVRERERLQKQVVEYGKQLSSNLLTEKQTADLTAKRTAAIAAIRASGATEADQSKAIAAVNAEFERQTTIMALAEDAKRRQVDLDAKMAGSAMTYREAIAALAQTKADAVVADEAAAAQAKRLADAQSQVEHAVDTLSEAFTNVILRGASLRDSLAGIFKQIASDILSSGIRSALMSQFGGTSGGFWSVLGSIFGGGADPLTASLRGAGLPARAGGGGVRAGSAYLVNENTPHSEVFVPSVNGAVLNVAQAQSALRSQGASAGAVDVRVYMDEGGNWQARVEQISGNVAAKTVSNNSRRQSDKQYLRGGR